MNRPCEGKSMDSTAVRDANLRTASGKPHQPWEGVDPGKGPALQGRGVFSATASLHPLKKKFARP